MTTKTLFARTAAQATLFNAIVLPGITEADGWYSNSRPFNHGEFWEGVQVKVAKTDEAVGIDFDAGKKTYDLMETSFVDANLPFAQKALGKDYTRKQFRADLWSMMWDMRSVHNGPKASTNIGKFPDHTGRPTADMLAEVTKPKKAKASKKTVAGAKRSAGEHATA